MATVADTRANKHGQYYLSAWKALATGLHFIFGFITTEKNSGGDGRCGSNKSQIIITRKCALQDVREDYGGTLTSPKMSIIHLEACKEDTTTYKNRCKDPEGHVKPNNNATNFKPYNVVLQTHTKQVKECTYCNKLKFMSPTARIAGVNREQDDERTRSNEKDTMEKTVSHTCQAREAMNSKLEDWGSPEVAAQKVLKTEKFEDHRGSLC